MEETQKNIACRIFKEQLDLINELPEDERALVLYHAINNSFIQFENQNENQNESTYISISISLSNISKSILNLLSKNIVFKEYSSNYGGRRVESGRKPVTSQKTKVKDNTKKVKKEKIDFDIFYDLYPIKKSKQAANSKWDRLSLEDQKKCIEVLESYNYKQWLNEQDMKYIKHPSTWLNQGCWEDDLIGETTLEYKPRRRKDEPLC